MTTTVAVAVLQILLEPLGGLEIQVIGRLVEQQHVAGRHELARQAEPSALAARQRLERTRARFGGVEAEAVKHGIDARRDRVAAVVLESLEVVAVARERRLAGVRAERDRLLGQRALEGEQARRTPPPLPPRPSSHRRNRGAARAATRAAPPRGTPAPRGFERAGDEPEERRLARAVAADDPPLVASGDGDGDIVEQIGGAEVDVDVGQRELGHEGNRGQGSGIGAELIHSFQAARRRRS